MAAYVATMSMLPMTSIGCGRSRTYQFSSTPTGATIYRMQAQRIVRKLGKTPRTVKEPTVFGAIANDVGMDSTWGDFYFLFLPLSVPLATVSKFAECVSPPWGPTTYGAALNGTFLLEPSSVESTTVSFDFSSPTGTGAARPKNLSRWLKGKPYDAVRGELGEPRTVAKDGLDGQETWRYEGFDVVFAPQTLRVQSVISREMAGRQ